MIEEAMLCGLCGHNEEWHKRSSKRHPFQTKNRFQVVPLKDQHPFLFCVRDVAEKRRIVARTMTENTANGYAEQLNKNGYIEMD